MDIQSVKIDLIQWLTKLHDKPTLQLLQELKDHQELNIALNSEQQKELENRLDKYKNNEMKFSSWEDAKERIRNKAKDVL